VARRTPPSLPEFLVDRSLGRHQLSAALREVGFVAHTLASIYGEQEAQRVRDEDWITLAGAQEWVVLAKDIAMRRRPAELQAIVAHRVKVFVVTSAKLTGPQQVERILKHRHRIVQAARKPGQFLCRFSYRAVSGGPRSRT